MKKFATLLVLCCFALKGFSQFTITSATFPVFDFQFFEVVYNPAGPNLVPSVNGDWDFSTYHGTDTLANFYVPETDPFYTNAGVDVYIDDFKALNANLGYIIYYEYDFNNAGVDEKGFYVGEQRYGLGALTGNAQDSLIFPLQGAILTTGKKLMKYPATYQKGWHSQSRCSVDFQLSVAAAGLNHTPSQHRYTNFRSDTIVGWGKMRVYSNGGTSIPYDVLIDKVNQYAIDSFFVGGAPAPAVLLSAFGMTQGQQTGLVNRYIVYRPGRSTPLAIFKYGSNNYTTPALVGFDTENLMTTGVETPGGASYSTLLFPNPSSTGELNLQVLGDAPAFSTYTITDMMGRNVQSGTADMENGIFHLSLNNRLPAGNYVLQVVDDKKQTVVTEQFVKE